MLFDLSGDEGGGERGSELQMLILVLLVRYRSPDEAKIKTKMLYASSKDALRRALVGVAIEIQGTDHSEIAYEASESRYLLSSS